MFSVFTSRRGFSVLELTLFAAIFSIISIVFITILVVVTRIQVRQASASEVNSQSQTLLQTIQRQIEQASFIDLTADQATSSLKLRMASAVDPTFIYLQNGVVYLKQTNAGAAQPLTSDRVVVSNLTFTKRQNANARDSVSTSFTVTYSTINPQQAFSQILNTSIARVSAATFDSNLNASPNNGTYSLGTVAGEWQSINSTLYFSGSNVGIGVSGPTQKFEVNSGDVYIDSPTRGVILRTPNGLSCYRVTVTNAGALTTALVAGCP